MPSTGLFRIKRGAWLIAVVLLSGATGCGIMDPMGSCLPDRICVTGSVQYNTIEGGFWAIRGDDDVTYDPTSGLPADFRQPGLRVHMVARERRDLIGFHQAGPIVEIIALRRLQ